MSEPGLASFLYLAAVLLLVVTAAGLFAMWRAGAAADQMMAGELMGTSGVAVLLLLSVAMGDAAVLDVALLLVILAAFAGIAFRIAVPQRPPGPGGQGPGGRRS